MEGDAPREPDAVARRLNQARLEQGRRLREARLAKGLSWAALGKLAAVPPATLSAWYRGRRPAAMMPLAVARRLCDVLQINMDWLAGRRSDPGMPVPPGQEAAQLTQPEREADLLKLAAQVEMMKRLHIVELTDMEILHEFRPREHPEER